MSALRLFSLGALIAASSAIAQDDSPGPIPPDLARMSEEWSCAQERETPGYFASLNGAEVSDSERSLFYPCASFLGSMQGDNEVFAWRSVDSYQGVLFMNNRRPGELYLTGGNNPPPMGVVPPGPYVARVDDTTGKEIWRTVLQNGNVTGEWVGAANLNILPDGTIPISFGNHLVKLDGDTGRILQYVSLPAGAPPEGSNYKHLTVAPDGTLILKNQTRPTPCDIQGTLAAFQCPGGANAAPGSTILAVDADTFEILDRVEVPENAVAPHIVTTHGNRIAIHAGGNRNAYRFFWDPESKSLSQDMDWVAQYSVEGQTLGDAPSVLGDWLVVQMNGLPSTGAASSITAIHMDDPTRITRIFPFGTELPTGQSWAPPKAAVDPENNMVFSADQNMGLIGGIDFDPETGEMSVAWTLEAATTALQGVYGPADARVLGTARAEPGTTLEQLNQTSQPTYRQQALWLDAKTGEILAESPYLEPMTFNTLLTPGFGGRFYYMHDQGFYVLKVVPKRS